LATICPMKLSANSSLEASGAFTSGVDFIMCDTVGDAMCSWWRLVKSEEVLM
jgi:nitrogenase subunit NifH